MKLMRKLLRKFDFVPDQLVTDDLRSYGVAADELGIDSRHERGWWKNSRAENSYQPTRRRKRKMQRFKSPGSAQRFTSTHAAVYNVFNLQHQFTSVQKHRAFRATAMNTWREALAAALKCARRWPITLFLRQRETPDERAPGCSGRRPDRGGVRRSAPAPAGEGAGNDQHHPPYGQC
jgi:hypothetical protein